MALQLNKLSILVVEDVAPMRQLLMVILETLGVGRVISAIDGYEGFETFCAEKPDIVITDWHMQPIDGIDLTRKIRKAPESPDKTVPVIMLTGFNSLNRIEISRDAGVTEYLAKPFTAEGLIKRIAHVIENPRDFVLTPTYFGPDRRRKAILDYRGPYRRMNDELKVMAG
ncbi:MAG: response regulator [Rhodospirillales bacterium]|nr:response regulator [Alphaproteobacteria bacterium]MCB1840878.1 response regulator [Alphaproteobacteria bacterium]MCB9977058.1 response regulator [Rhodospirillales bacterium]